jgi:hypothetical protein
MPVLFFAFLLIDFNPAIIKENFFKSGLIVKMQTSGGQVKDSLSLFLDSIAAKASINPETIIKRTRLSRDEVDYYQFYEGDTVFFRRNRYCKALVLVGNGVCSKEILLIYDNIKHPNTDNKWVMEDCDTPEGENRMETKFKILPDQTIRITDEEDTFLSEDHYKKSRVITYWKVDESGKLKQIPKKK